MTSRLLNGICYPRARSRPARAFPVAVRSQAHSHAAPNGGQIQQMGTYEGELVLMGTEVTLFVVDANEKKVDTAPLSATATVLAKGNVQKTVEMKPSGENRLTGKVDFL